MTDNQGAAHNEELKRRIDASRQAQEAEAQVRGVLMRILEQPAYDRLMNVKISNAELFAKAVNGLVYMFKKTGRRITERELLTLLSAAVDRRISNIEIRRK